MKKEGVVFFEEGGGGRGGGGGREGLISRCTLCFLGKLKGKGRPFLEGRKKGATL